MQPFTFSGQTGALEGQWHQAVGECRGGAVVLHPHPLYGGSMDNLVVVEAACALAARGIETLRFNFRGVGHSGGEHDKGVGEVQDLASAVDACVERLIDRAGPSPPLWLVGYSFGAAVLLAALGGGLPQAQAASGGLLLAPPITHYDFSAVRKSSVPLAVLCGTEDALTPRTAMDACQADWLKPVALEWIAGAGHDLGSFDHSDTLRAGLGSCLSALGVG